MNDIQNRAIDRVAEIILMDRRKETDKQAYVIDLLADLMHWCDTDGVDFSFCLDCALGHHAAEAKGEGL